MHGPWSATRRFTIRHRHRCSRASKRMHRSACTLLLPPPRCSALGRVSQHRTRRRSGARRFLQHRAGRDGGDRRQIRLRQVRHGAFADATGRAWRRNHHVRRALIPVRCSPRCPSWAQWPERIRRHAFHCSRSSQPRPRQHRRYRCGRAGSRRAAAEAARTEDALSGSVRIVRPHSPARPVDNRTLLAATGRHRRRKHRIRRPRHCATPCRPGAAAAARNANGSEPDLDVVVAPSIILRYPPMNTMQKPFDNPKVRQAIAYAINKDAIAKIAFNGYATPAEGHRARGRGILGEDRSGAVRCRQGEAVARRSRLSERLRNRALVGL